MNFTQDKITKYEYDLFCNLVYCITTSLAFTMQS